MPSMLLQAATILLGYSRFVLPLLAIWVLSRCIRSMLREEYEPEAWAYLETDAGELAVVRHWECLIGRAPSSDIIITRPDVDRSHAVLMRSGRGVWSLHDLGTAKGTRVNGQPIGERGIDLQDRDELRIAHVPMHFRDLDEKQRAEVDRHRSIPGRVVHPGLTLFLLSIYQILLGGQFMLTLDSASFLSAAACYAVLILAQWFVYFITRALGRSGYEVETLAFFLSTLGLTVVVSSAPGELIKQVILLLAGIGLFVFLGIWLRDLTRARAVRWPLAAIGLGLLLINLVAGETTNGATNWLRLGPITLQPSEFVKLAYIYAGTATLDRLFRRRNLFGFIAFSAACVGALALMGDFGTALIFFVTFLVISFMRSGSFATVFLAVGGAAIAVMLVLTVRPYVAQRFSSWRHIWEDPLGGGWQQTRGLSAAASGGLFGVGAGQGWLKTIFAADMDMVFCMVCEELGLITAFVAMLALVALALFAVRSAARGRSSFYVIAACASASMLLVQLSLNVFGSVDLLPFTGVTFPFVSRGGSSLISCWGMMAFLKAADTRQRASFSVQLSSRPRRAKRSRRRT